MEKAEFTIDLHSHSNRSDGADTPYEWILHAEERGMKVVALTDHDVVPPMDIETPDGMMDFVECGKEHGISVIRGIEVSSDTNVDDVHLVCFGCDWSDPYWQEMMDDVVKSKIESYKELIEILSEDGMKMTWEEVLDNNGHPVPEDQIQKKMLFELIARKGYTEDWTHAKLMIKNTPRYAIKRRRPDPIEVIKEVDRMGGIVIDAHPFLINEPVDCEGNMISRYDYIERLIAAGLKGIEALYTYDKTSYNGKENKWEIEKYIRETYTDRVPIISGGSDYHDDARKHAKKIREMGECGITEEYFYNNPLLAALV
ncbi:MAG: PHP domain-containing protein [Lachnospiraceae bacterium]|nr:PHP domain-containing protein [Lachnospiraceae bacterium]